MSLSRQLRTSIALVLGAAAVLALGACRDQRVLARVGSRVVTVDDFTDYARAARNRYPWLPDSTKRMLLDDLIRRELMMNEAQARGITSDTLLDAIRRTTADNLLGEALGRQISPAAPQVSDDEIAAYHRGLGTELHLQVIATLDSSGAIAAKRRVLAGERFADVARAYNTSGIVPPDGDLGWHTAGSAAPALDERVRNAKVGTLVGPVNAGADTWIVAVLLGRRKTAEVPPLSQLHDRIQALLAQRKQQAVVQRLVSDLRAEYHLTLDPAGPQALFTLAQAQNDTSGTTVAPDPGVALAHYDSPREGIVSYTLADALGDLRNGAQGPDFSSVPSIRSWILSRAVQKLVVLEAHRRLLDQEPEVQRAIRDRVDGAVIQSLYETEVLRAAQVTDDDLRAEYLRRTEGREVPPFEAMPAEMREQLRELTLQTRREQLLRAFTETLYRKYPVSVDEPLLKRVTLPLATSPAPPQNG